MNRVDRNILNSLIGYLKRDDIDDENRTLFEDWANELFLKERKHNRAKEIALENLPYSVLNKGRLGKDWDASRWEKRLYPGQDWNADEIRNFISDEWEYVGSPYDCSGKWFTSHISIFHRPEGMVVYIISSLDV